MIDIAGRLLEINSELETEINRLREENARLREALEGLQEIIARKYEIRTDIEGGKEYE